MTFENVVNILIYSWFWMALILSFYWGIRATFLFAKDRNLWWKSYQFIFNFVGSFAGWGCMLY